MVSGNFPELLSPPQFSLRKSRSLPSSPLARTPTRLKRRGFRAEAIHPDLIHTEIPSSEEIDDEGLISLNGASNTSQLSSQKINEQSAVRLASSGLSLTSAYKPWAKGWLRSTAEGSLPLWVVTRERGFLPSVDPPTTAVTHTQTMTGSALNQLLTLEALLGELPKLVVAAAGKPGALRRALTSAVREADVSGINDEAQAWRAFTVLSFLAHVYVWGDFLPPANRLPAPLARPWCQLAWKLGVPPVMSYATYNLLNWRRLDPRDSIELGNIVCLANFNGGLDEEWFRLIHVAIEQQAAPAIAAISDAHDSIRSFDVEKVSQSLETIKITLRTMLETLKRMQSACDPHVYYHRVRPYTSGWRNSTDLPDGLIYEGVSEEPMKHYGATGAQSAVLPALDAALGVQHPPGWLSDYLRVMREHMPGEHRRALQAIEQGPSIRAFVQEHFEKLAGPYDEALRELYAFRNQHKSFAFSYIKKQSKLVDEKGTGGTDYMPYLDKHARTTREHLLSN